ncbi:endoplasmic reticulum protein SC65-like [Denticeps clupeoides]|uniref:Leprecan-like alpha-helical domain-containing protein n=1 Tax=Denticeps clupeoides TaxID=299321 RepID=A0AAY4A1F4_9TELE|nr:endoplasmic reticulum protein SC65-like [Denticeps clupeoides]
MQHRNLCWFEGLVLVYLRSSVIRSAEEPPELLSVGFVYGKALDSCATENWSECVRFLELSLRLHGLLQEGAAFCSQTCAHGGQAQEDLAIRTDDLRGFWDTLMRTSCMKKCKTRFPIFLASAPSRGTLEDFRNRTPYRHLHLAYHHLNNTERAASAAHTYLQKNPGDQAMADIMSRYKASFDLDGSLTDHEQKPYERSFVQGVLLFYSEDHRGSAAGVEEAVGGYMKEYDLCAASCEGLNVLYSSTAEAHLDALRCKVQCEDTLTPNVGGFFVENFVATMYHYLQFSYHELGDVPTAVSCGSSYMLFDPNNTAIRQNMELYISHRQEWGLEQRHFVARREAVRYYNLTTAQKKMLEYAENYLRPDEATGETPKSEDAEFAGIGHHEESISATRCLAPKAKGDTGDSTT